VRLTEKITDFKLLIVMWESRTDSCDYSDVNSSFFRQILGNFQILISHESSGNSKKNPFSF